MNVRRIIALLSIVFLTRATNAAVLPCQLYTTDSLFPARFTVDIWIFNQAAGGLVTPMTATGLSFADVKLAAERAAEIWNEQSGASMRLRVRSTTTAIGITDALVITGQATVCDSKIAVAYVNAGGGSPTHRFVNGTIEIRQKSTAVSCSVNTNWCVYPNTSGCIDLVAVLVHELGHAAFNLDHPNTGANCTNVSGGGASVMWSSYVGTRARELKQWDLELAQRRYTPRSNTSAFWRNQLSGSSTWVFPGTPMSTTGTPLIRPGSMPANTSRRYLGWLRGITTANDGGTGEVTVGYYANSGMPSSIGYGGWSLQKGLTRTVAMAGYRSSNLEPLILVYQKYISPQPSQYAVDTDRGVICYRLSTDGLANLGSEQCSSAETAYFGVTATYDYNNDAYLVTYIANDSMAIGLLTIPNINNSWFVGGSYVLGAYSHHAGSIACSPVDGCKLFYEGFNNNGSLSWLNLAITSFGTVWIASTYSTGYATLDTPSAAYWSSDGSFRVAYTLSNSAVYTYKVVGNTITGTGDAFNNFNSFVSSPLVNPRVTTGGSRLYTWFVKPW